MRNDPSLRLLDTNTVNVPPKMKAPRSGFGTTPSYHGYNKTNVSTRKTIMHSRSDDYSSRNAQPHYDDPNRCPIHRANHNLADCRAFNSMSYDNKTKLLKDKQLCFKCFEVIIDQ